MSNYYNNDSGGESFDDNVPEPDQVLYADKSDAKMAADARGCSGSHPHDVDGRTHHMPCESHSDYHDADGAMSGQSEGSYVGGPFDLTTGISGDGDMTSGDPLDTDGGFLEGRPREGAKGVDITRDIDSGEFSDAPASPDNTPLGLERDPDSGRIGVDPFVVGNFGQFNSPYDSTDNEDKEKYE